MAIGAPTASGPELGIGAIVVVVLTVGAEVGGVDVLLVLEVVCPLDEGWLGDDEHDARSSAVPHTAVIAMNCRGRGRLTLAARRARTRPSIARSWARHPSPTPSTFPAMTTTREVSYTADGRNLVGTLTLPSGDDPRPGVLISHEGPGLDDFGRG